MPKAAGLQMIEEQQVLSARLGLTDGTGIEVIRPSARNDSIIYAYGTERVSYEDVSRVTVKETDGSRTLALVVGIPVLLVLFAFSGLNFDNLGNWAR